MSKLFFPLSFFLLLLFSCINDFTLLEDEFELLSTSENFVFYQHHSDTSSLDIDRQEAYYHWLNQQLGFSLQEKIHFYKYPDRATLLSITSRDANAFAQWDRFRIHTIWPYDNHECVHIMVNNLYGVAPALFDEGIAVAYQAYLVESTFVPQWNRMDFDSIARSHLLDNTLPEFEQMVESDSFREIGSMVSYPISGSFTSFIIEQYGVGKLLAFISASRYNQSSAKTRKKFSEIFPVGLETTWDQWVESL